MRHFFDWFGERARPEEPWLILGKGPSYDQLASHDVRGYRTLSLNHVVRERAVDVAHVIDVDVVEQCADALRGNAGVLVVPWHPHAKNKAGDDNLAIWVSRIPVLAELDATGRLLTYDLSTFPRADGPPPSRLHAATSSRLIVQATYFSAEAALSLLALFFFFFFFF